MQQARAAGLKAPVIMMGYYNPFLAYGEKKIVEDAKAAGKDLSFLSTASHHFSVLFSFWCIYQLAIS